MKKLPWSGRITSVQPRIRLTRSFDQRSHSYLGYCLVVDGVVGDESRAFSIGIGKATQQKHQFRVGDEVSGESLPVTDDSIEPVEFYKTSKLKVLRRSEAQIESPPPWHGVPPNCERETRRQGDRETSDMAALNKAGEPAFERNGRAEGLQVNGLLVTPSPPLLVTDAGGDHRGSMAARQEALSV